MEKIIFEKLKQTLKSKGEIKILSTDVDKRFDDACKILSDEVPNIKYINIDSNFIKNYENKEDLFNLYKEIRSGKEDEKALTKNFNDPNFFATLLVKSGWASGIVSGATHPTSSILRPAFQIIKTRTKGEVISSLTWLSKDNYQDMFFADISVIPNPDFNQLSQIAIQTANSVKKIFNVKPVVAMLSFSTKGSGGKQDDVIKVQEATKLVEKSGIKVYGEIQWDAAIRKEIFSKKMGIKNPKDMPNVFIFPDLNSGNIGYKIAATLGEFNAVGPILQNIDKPINDLSRGCNPREIADLVIITALQTIEKKGN